MSQKSKKDALEVKSLKIFLSNQSLGILQK